MEDSLLKHWTSLSQIFPFPGIEVDNKYPPLKDDIIYYVRK